MDTLHDSQKASKKTLFLSLIHIASPRKKLCMQVLGVLSYLIILYD